LRGIFVEQAYLLFTEEIESSEHNTPIRETTDIRRIRMANILSQHWLLNRRHVLRGLGVSLALPLLDCMRPLRAGEAATRAKRSVFIYLPNGVNTIDYQITQAGADYRFSRSLQVLGRNPEKANLSRESCYLWMNATWKKLGWTSA
jgi:hypothetical protein